jgi:hypothetical protein
MHTVHAQNLPPPAFTWSGHLPDTTHLHRSGSAASVDVNQSSCCGALEAASERAEPMLWANGMLSWWAKEKSTGSRRPEDASTRPLIRSCDRRVIEKVAPPGLTVVECESPTAASNLTGIYIPTAPVHQPKAAGTAYIATTTSQHPQRRVNANNGRRTDAGRKHWTAEEVESGYRVQGVEIRQGRDKIGEKSPTSALTESPTTTGEVYTHPQPIAPTTPCRWRPPTPTLHPEPPRSPPPLNLRAQEATQMLPAPDLSTSVSLSPSAQRRARRANRSRRHADRGGACKNIAPHINAKSDMLNAPHSVPWRTRHAATTNPPRTPSRKPEPLSLAPLSADDPRGGEKGET